MKAKNLLLLLTLAAVAGAGRAHSQNLHPGVNPGSPNIQNQNLDTMQQIRLMDEQRLLDEQRRHDAQQGNGAVSAHDRAIVQGQISKFMQAIKPRKGRFADFDQVVFHSKTPLTTGVLAVMSESPYAADIAYYLGKHPEQSGAIAQMGPTEAGQAVRQLEATIAAENAGRK